MTKMSRTINQPVRKSPLLIVSLNNKNRLEKKRMMRMSVKKLKNIRDPESLLYKAVLINNTLESLRNTWNTKSIEMGVLAPGSAHARPSAQPPLTLAEIFRRTCLQSNLQNLRKKLKIT